MQVLDLSEYPAEMINRKDLPVAIDTETAGTNYVPYYFSWAAKDLGAGGGPFLSPKGGPFIKKLAESSRPKIFHNCKFDIRVLAQLGIEVKGEIHDTSLMHALLDEHHIEAHRLKALAREILGRPRLDEYELHEEQRKYPKEEMNLHVPQTLLHKYAVADAQDTLDLFYVFKPQLIEEGLWDLYRDEVAAALVYLEIEDRGVLVDMNALDSAWKEIIHAQNIIQAKVWELFGQEFKLSSPRQVGEVMGRIFALTERTPTGQWRVSKQVLEKYIDDPRVQYYFAWKFLDAARAKLENYARCMHEDGRLHPSYRQTTTTGRTACSEPNLQNIPKQRGRITEVEVGDPELAKMCREAFRSTRRVFVAPEGATLYSFDYSQIEYRVAVHYTGSKRLIEALRRGEDVHSMICQLVFGKVDPRTRHITKMINYGCLYGMGMGTLKQKVLQGEPGVDAEYTMRLYRQKSPELLQLQREATLVAQRRGYVKDVFGRKYRYDPDRPYAMVAWLCQGTAANIKKYAIRRVHEILKGRRSGIIMDIHDEIVLEVYPEDEHLLPKIKEAMEDFPQFSVPITVDAAKGPNLLDMEGVEL